MEQWKDIKYLSVNCNGKKRVPVSVELKSPLE